MGISFKKGFECTILGYCNSDWGRDRADRRSVAGYMFMFANGPISWLSKKENVFAQSIAEAEYIAFSFVVKEAL